MSVSPVVEGRVLLGHPAPSVSRCLFGTEDLLKSCGIIQFYLHTMDENLTRDFHNHYRMD